MRGIRRLSIGAACLVIGAGASEIAHVQLADAEPANDWGHVVEARTSPRLKVTERCQIAALGVAPWLTPGRPMGAVWEADTLAALAAMGVPEATARTLVQRIRSGNPDETADFSDYEGIGSTGNRYLPGVSMTYRSAGKPALCQYAELRLNNRHRPERAMVWHLDGYSIAVFAACGNVARVLLAPPGWAPFLPPPLPQLEQNPGAPLPPPVPGPGIAPPPPVYPPGVAPLPYYPPPRGTHDVPEPSSIALVLLALAALAGRLIKTNRKRT